MYNVIYDRESVITPIISSVRWGGDIKQAYRFLNIRLMNTEDGVKQLLDINNGNLIEFQYKDETKFTGIIFSTRMNEEGRMEIVAYDDNVYLTKNHDTRIFRGLKASSIIRRLATDFGIPLGTIEDTGYVIPKKIFRNSSLWEIIKTVLEETEKQTGKRFFVYSEKGKLNVKERKHQISQWVLENKVNILNADYSKNIDDMRTQIKVMGGDPEKNPVIAEVKDERLINKYGKMQHLEEVDSDTNKSQMKQIAQQLLAELGTISDEANLRILGISDIISGSAVYIKESMTGITGSYYVTTDEHTFEGSNYITNLKLTATDELSKMEYGGN